MDIKNDVFYPPLTRFDIKQIPVLVDCIQPIDGLTVLISIYLYKLSNYGLELILFELCVLSYSFDVLIR